MEKALLRKIYLEKRINLSPAEYSMLNAQVQAQLDKIDWGEYNTIHIFLPILQLNEIDTFAIISYLKIRYPFLQIVVPRSDFKRVEMEHVLFDLSQNTLEKNKYGIPEPIEGKLILSEQVDLVFIPLLVFDKKGYRVGYGKGFYDRFLAQCRSDVQKIGLSFFEPVDKISDIGSWDIQLNQCICPDKVWEF